MLRSRLFQISFALLLAHASSGAPILVEGFEALAPGWKKGVGGKGSVTIVPGEVKGNCLRIEARGKLTSYYTTMLPLAAVKGKRVIVRAKVKLDNVVRGDKVYCEAKLHALIRFQDKKQAPRNVATRFRGTADWHDQIMIVEVPDDAVSVQLDLGIQSGDGVVYYDSLVVDDGVKDQICVNLENVTNTCRQDISQKRGYGGFLDAGDMDLRAFPGGDVKFGGVDFYVMADSEAYGRSCIVLAGGERPELPARTLAVAPVKAKAKGLFLLHTAVWSDPASKRACLFVDVTYGDGRTHTITVREGVDVGRFDVPADAPNWQLGWTGKRGQGKLGVGVSQWPLPHPDAQIAHLRFRSPGDAAVPVVLAVSLDPVKKPSTKKGAK